MRDGEAGSEQPPGVTAFSLYFQGAVSMRLLNPRCGKRGMPSLRHLAPPAPPPPAPCSHLCAVLHALHPVRQHLAGGRGVVLVAAVEAELLAAGALHLRAGAAMRHPTAASGQQEEDTFWTTTAQRAVHPAAACRQVTTQKRTSTLGSETTRMA